MNLFDNPMVQNAKASMSQEQQDEYKRIGEEMYNTIEFDTNTVLNNVEDPSSEPLAYIMEALKSGLAPEYLSEDEKNFMIKYYGDDWYTKFGFEDGGGDGGKDDGEELKVVVKQKRNDKCACGSNLKFKYCCKY